MDFVAVHAYLRASLAGRECRRVGPFLASFSRLSENPYFNYALPDDGARPTAGDVQALIDAYRSRGLKPRLEYIPDLAPEVEPALLRAGFTPESTLTLMGWEVDSTSAVGPPAGIELVAPDNPADLLSVRAVQHEAYNEPAPPGEREVESLRRTIDAGGGAVLARRTEGHEAAGAGEFTPPIAGVSEITSIAVRPAYRRRGVATAMCAWLVDAAARAGATTPFLMANEAEARIYARAGFSAQGRILHISNAMSQDGASGVWRTA